MKVCEFRGALLAAIRAHDAAKFPRCETRGTNQIAITALSRGGFVLQKAYLGTAAAKRAMALTLWDLSSHRLSSILIDPSEVGLQERLLKKLNVRGTPPIRHQLFGKDLGIGFGKSVRLSRQCGWAKCF